MIRLIAAIDTMRGIANEKGIPWDLPSDKKYYKEKIREKIVLMGKGTYETHSKPLGRANYVLTSHVEPLRAGFHAIGDIDTILRQNLDIWVIGGSKIFELMLPYADELYITQVEGDFNCTKFFPSFGDNFVEVDKSKIHKENGTRFQYQIWKSKKLTTSSDYEDIEAGV